MKLHEQQKQPLSNYQHFCSIPSKRNYTESLSFTANIKRSVGANYFTAKKKGSVCEANSKHWFTTSFLQQHWFTTSFLQQHWFTTAFLQQHWFTTSFLQTLLYLVKPFLIGRMFLREPSSKYSGKLAGS